MLQGALQSVLKSDLSALVSTISYTFQMMFWVERRLFSTKAGTIALASPLLNASMKQALVPFSQIAVLSHTCQIIILQLSLSVIYLLDMYAYINKKKRKTSPNHLLYLFSNNAKM